MPVKSFPIQKNQISIPLEEFQKLIDYDHFSISISIGELKVQEKDRETQILEAFEEASNAPESDFYDI